MNERLARTAPWALSAVCALAYVIAAPPSTDLAAAAYRSDLFSRVGFTLWDNSWYGGHHLPAYSLLAPALGAWLGPQLLNAFAMVAATALFALLVDGLFSRRATFLAALWFAVGASLALLANRVPYDLGLAIGLGCLLAARHRRRPLALAMALLCSAASPVAGAFLALALLAWAIARSGPRLWPLLLTAAALAPIALLTIAFPEGGTQPFVASAFFPALAGVVVLALLAARSGASDRGETDVRSGTGSARSGSDTTRRVLLTGVLLYAAALICAYVIPSAVGGNVDRLGALVAGPVAALLLVDRGPRWLLALLAPLLLYWQANAPVTDFVAGIRDPSVHASYFAPLVHELHALGVGYGAAPARVESVPSVDHWEARWLAPQIPLARGWERQLDRGRNALFYEEGYPLDATRYQRWLAANAVSYVALPDAPLDYSAKAEARLLNGVAPDGGGGRPPAYLREVWRSAHWRLFAVRDPQPLAQLPARVTQLSSDAFAVSVPRAGSYEVRVRFSPYWRARGASACVREAANGFTDLETRRAGLVHVGIDFSLARIFDHGPRCG